MTQHTGVGQFTALHADYNSQVRGGQVIARLEPSLFQTQVEQSRATLQRLQAEVDAAKVHVEDTQVTREKPTFRLKPEATREEPIFRLKPEATREEPIFRLKPEATGPKPGGGVGSYRGVEVRMITKHLGTSLNSRAATELSQSCPAFATPDIVK